MKVKTLKPVVTAGKYSMPVKVGSIIDVPDSTQLDDMFELVSHDTPVTSHNSAHVHGPEIKE